MGHSFDMLTFDFLLKPPQPVTGLFFTIILYAYPTWVRIRAVCTNLIVYVCYLFYANCTGVIGFNTYTHTYILL